MYCFRCGQELPRRSVNCPACDTPQKRRQRYRQRLFLGLFIFISGAFVGSLVDSLCFQGRTWTNSIFHSWFQEGKTEPEVTPPPSERVAPPPELPVAPHDVVPSTVPVKTPVSHPVMDLPMPDPTRVAAVPATEPGSSAVPTPTPTPTPTRAGEAPLGSHLAQTASSAQITPHPDVGSVPLPMVPVPPPSVPTETIVFSDVPTQNGGTSTPTIPPPDPSGPSSAPNTDLKAPETPKIPDGTLSLHKTDPVEEGPGTNFHGSLSTDMKVLIFASNRPSGGANNRFQCYIKEMENPTAVIKPFAWPGNVWTPEFSRDGKALVFSSDSVSREQVFLHDRQTQVTKQLTQGGGKNMMPALSPDGKFIVFVSDRKGSEDIWMMETDGSNLVQITSGPNDDREPRWFPDGKAIIFTRIVEKLKVSQIMKIQLDPQEPPKAVVADGKRNWSPDVCPDGKHFAFIRSENPDGSSNQIVVRRFDSSKETLLTPFKGGENFHPIWTPDGNGLVFHTERNGKKNLFQARFQRKTAD